MPTPYLKQACVFIYIKNIYIICYVQWNSLIQHQLDRSCAGLLNTPNFLWVIFVTLQPTNRECAFTGYFHFITRRLSCFNYHRPTQKFSFGPHCCTPLIHHLVQLPKYRDFWSIGTQFKGILLCIRASKIS